MNARRYRVRGPGQRGVALITALLVVALATVTAVAMTSAQQLATRRTANLLHSDQAYVYALGIEDWARGALQRDLAADLERRQRVDAPREAWALGLPPTAVPGGTVRGHMADLQGRYNLNNLIIGNGLVEVAYLRRLLTVLELDPELADRIGDWLDPDVDARFPGGAEDLKYLRADVPYRTANGPMASVTELRLVDGVTPEVYERLAPYVTALPEPTTININTAPEQVLRALDSVIAEHVDDVLRHREREPFEHIAAFLAVAGLDSGADGAMMGSGGGAVPDGGDLQPAPQGEIGAAGRTDLFAPLIGVSSDYFVVHADARMERLQVRLESVVSRTGEDATPRIIARTRRVY